LELNEAPGVAMAMFPLGTVLFPHALLPLHVFEPRYRLMMRHVLDGDHEFGVVLIERGSEVGGGDTRFDVATVARVVQAAELPDGRYALATVGMRRVRVARWLDDDPYPRAEVVALDDPPAGPGDAGARDRVVDALARVTELARRIDPRIEQVPELDADPLRASYEAAALAPIGPLDAQRLLAATDARTRLGLLADLLGERAVDLRARLDLDG
jgi:Lon protease-like protein